MTKFFLMIFDKEKLLLIAGPCAIENEEVTMACADCLSEAQKSLPNLNIVFKGSFDKANRSSIFSKRGVGLSRGLEILSEVKVRYGFRLTTDIHAPDQADPVAEVCDAIQIPAFLCRQTDLIVAAAETQKAVSVKKGQFLSPQEMKHVVTKLRESHASEIWQIERGSSFGYNNLVVDMRSFYIMKKNNCPTIFDATHSVQLPGTSSKGTGGDRTFVPILAKAAIASGADGLFFEIHPDPKNAISDSENQIATTDFPKIIKECFDLWFFLKKENQQSQ
jgi:2-dehydro-3-deoxyphosphooctonate aldolase (KDO 8-P synthase)